MSLSEFVNSKLSSEEYAFSRDEYMLHSGKDTKLVATDLAYLSEKKEIIALRKGFYIIIPPRYLKLGVLPLELYIDKLFQYLKKPYYVGLYSASKIHGASHQQIQKHYLVTKNSKMLDIQKGNISIDFFLCKNWPETNIIQKKSDAGYFKVSDPILTIVDLIYHQRKLGGINRMLSNIEELLEEVKVNQLEMLLKWYPHKSVLQRLGFLIEYLDPENDLLISLYNYLKSQKFYPVLLNSADSNKPGAVNNKWKVDINLKLDNDL